MNEKDIENRLKLSKTITDKNYSVRLRETISKIYQRLSNLEREKIALKIIPIVQNSKTEQEAMKQILKL